MLYSTTLLRNCRVLTTIAVKWNVANYFVLKLLVFTFSFRKKIYENKLKTNEVCENLKAIYSLNPKFTG